MKESTAQTRDTAAQTIRLMNAATLAARSDPFQKGRLIELPLEGDLLVTGDLHGNGLNLRRILQVADLPRHPRRHLILQELVHELDALDDTCRSYRLVEMAAQLKSVFPDRVHILLGNHEFAECISLEIGKAGRGLNDAFDEGLRSAYGTQWSEVKEAYRDFWRSCPLAVKTAGGIFISHSTPRQSDFDVLSLDYLRNATEEDVFRRDSPVFPMLWDRDYNSKIADAFADHMGAEVLIVGHTACNGLRVPNPRHIILDCKDMDARYALLPLNRKLNQRQVLAYVHRLHR